VVVSELGFRHGRLAFARMAVAPFFCLFWGGSEEEVERLRRLFLWIPASVPSGLRRNDGGGVFWFWVVILLLVVFLFCLLFEDFGGLFIYVAEADLLEY